MSVLDYYVLLCSGCSMVIGIDCEEREGMGREELGKATHGWATVP